VSSILFNLSSQFISVWFFKVTIVTNGFNSGIDLDLAQSLQNCIQLQQQTVGLQCHPTVNRPIYILKQFLYNSRAIVKCYLSCNREMMLQENLVQLTRLLDDKYHQAVGVLQILVLKTLRSLRIENITCITNLRIKNITFIYITLFFTATTKALSGTLQRQLNAQCFFYIFKLFTYIYISSNT